MILIPLLMTIVMETGLVLLLERRNIKDLVINSILINACTNPALNILIQYFGITSIGVILVLEAVVVLTETVLWHKLSEFAYKKSFRISLMLNAFSYIAGGMIYAYFI